MDAHADLDILCIYMTKRPISCAATQIYIYTKMSDLESSEIEIKPPLKVFLKFLAKHLKIFTKEKKYIECVVCIASSDQYFQCFDLFLSAIEAIIT